MRIKICGITNIEDAQLCCKYEVDAIGFVFYKKSKRYIEPEKAKEIIKQLPPFVLKVGVFVNEHSALINKTARNVKLNLIQLHGNENATDIDIIDLPVVKAFRVNNNFDYSELHKYKNCSFLLDAFDANEYGGTGRKFMWNKIPDEIKDKIILAGGIRKEDLKHIFQNIKPYAIDVSSSLELKPGKKDKEKIKLFFDEYKRVLND